MKDKILNELSTYKKRIDLTNNYSFLKIDNEKSYDEIVIRPIIDLILNEDTVVKVVSIQQNDHFVLLKNLTWETKYFNFPCYSIELILFDHDDYLILRSAINTLVNLHLPKDSFCKINIPSEDLILIQAISSTRFNLIETRLNYVLKLDSNVQSQFNKIIKKSENSDAYYLSNIAKKMSNKYDWIHADPTFSDETANEYLGMFAEESVKGFADIVLQCMNENEIPFGFLAANYPQDINDNYISKLVLAAIDNTRQRGLLFDLLNDLSIERKKSGVFNNNNSGSKHSSN